MCGFAGLLTTAACSRDELADHARRMSHSLAHRGPDDSGVWADEGSGVAFGFRRLAILDLSPHGHQPMCSASGRFVVAFNGEIYNFSDLRRELESHGHRFRGGSDTEVILAAFEQWGIRAAVRRFAGMFAMAVWDAERRQLSLFRDRLGKKPLYVYREPGLISFGSELKALIAGPSFDRTIDREALSSYLRYLYVPTPRTIFRHVAKLPAAHLLTVTDAGAPLPPAECYWSLQDAARAGLEDPIQGSDADAINELEGLLGEAVRCRLRSDVPLGALLSGGIDSSLVVALMQEASARPVKTFTIGFREEAFNEAPHAARVARYLGTDHTELLLTGEDAQTVVPRLPEIFDEPFADPSQLPTLLVAQLARQHVTVALCGDGGDELFGGYNRYVYGTRVLPRVNRIPRSVRQYVGAGLQLVPAAAWAGAHRAAGGLLPRVAGQRAGEQVHKLANLMTAASTGDMYRSLLSAWQQPQHLVRGGPAGDDPNSRILDQKLASGGVEGQLLDQMMLADQMNYLPDDLLAKVDRASMAVSLEVRAPLLDHRVAEHSWRLPRTLKVRGSVGKWILRQVLYRHVPQAIVERPKMGFSVPIDQWLRGPLREWGESLLAGVSDNDGLLKTSAVAGAWKDLQEGRRSGGAAMWAVLMFQAWRARWQV
jgi:asparagine synthase (glutamine-hydrolysing)